MKLVDEIFIVLNDIYTTEDYTTLLIETIDARNYIYHRQLCKCVGGTMMDPNQTVSEPLGDVLNECNIDAIVLNNNDAGVEGAVDNKVSDEREGIVIPPNVNKNHNVPHIVDDANSCLIRCEFRDHIAFDAFHNIISKCIRDTLFSLKKSTNVVVSRDEHVVQILEISGESDDDSMFMVDTLPAEGLKESEVPDYDAMDADILRDNDKRKEDDDADSDSNQTDVRPTNSCWNCGGNHCLKDCKEPHRPENISRNRQLYAQKNRTERYHLESDQRFGSLIPGAISDGLREALGLRSRELPLYIYKMRLYGYPPGWFEDAKVLHSGIALLDANVRIY